MQFIVQGSHDLLLLSLLKGSAGVFCGDWWPYSLRRVALRKVGAMV
jgi:hypothetical protein